MYLYLGAEKIVRKSDVVGIFELDGKLTTPVTGEFLKAAQRNGLVESAGEDLPKSFVIVKAKNSKKLKKVAVKPEKADIEKYGECGENKDCEKCKKLEKSDERVIFSHISVSSLLKRTELVI